MITRDPQPTEVSVSDEVRRHDPPAKAQQIRTDILAVGVLGFLTIIAFAIGFVPVVIYTHDLFIPLDGAWRVLNGQGPHVDFATSLGAVFYLIEAGGFGYRRVL